MREGEARREWAVAGFLITEPPGSRRRKRKKNQRWKGDCLLTL